MYVLTAGSGGATVEWDASCTGAAVLNVVTVVATDNGLSDSIGQAEHRFEDGTYISPTYSQYVDFLSSDDNTVVSHYGIQTGEEGSGVIPSAGSDVFMSVRDNGVSDFTFDASANNRMLALKTNTLLSSSVNDVTTLLSAATEITNIAALPVASNGDVIHEGSFTMSDSPTDNYLYLIYDLRTYSEEFISFGSTAAEACCDITCASGSGDYEIVNGSTGTTLVSYTNANTGAASSITLAAGQQTTIISATEPTSSVVSERITISLTNCN